LFRTLAVFALAAAIAGLRPGEVGAHAGLRASEPRDGVRLGDTPKQVKLSFFERPEVALSAIRVLDTAGTAYHLDRPEPLPADPLSLVIKVRPMKEGIYIVHWRIVSAVDGHATAGSYAFGVRVNPGGASTAAPNTYPAASRFEMVARWILTVGLVTLLGAATAAIGRFGGTRDLGLATLGWTLALGGLALLAEAQARNANSTVTDLLRTSIGRALDWRLFAIGAGALALAVARRSHRTARPGLHAAAMSAVAMAALAAMGVHVAAGHAAAVRRLPAAAIGIQWLHFAATGAWVGGLAALMTGVRGEPGAAKTQAVRRFSAMAGVALVVVAGTGLVRAVQEMSSWAQLASTAYGQAILAKVVLLIAIAGVGAVNRWRSVPAVPRTLHPLRRMAAVELPLMIAVLGVAAVLGALPPPSAGRLFEVSTMDVSGVDFATTVRARLTVGSDQPGPNRFTVRVVDYDSRQPIDGARVSLRFIPVDDPGMASSSLPLDARPDGIYEGSGANLSFDGRWKATVLVQRGSTSSEVPLEIETRTAPQPVSIQRMPGQAPQYTVTLRREGVIVVSPDPERPGPSTLHIEVADILREPRSVDDIVVTLAAGKAPARQESVHRVDRSSFTATVELRSGPNQIVVVAKATDGARLRAVLDITVPAR
jgi:copper transport protein